MDNYGARLAGNYGAWTSAVAICETAERLTAEEGEPALRQFLLVVGALRSLALAEHGSALVLDAFLIRSMSLAGWEPALERLCAVLGPRPARRLPRPVRRLGLSVLPSGWSGSAAAANRWS